MASLLRSMAPRSDSSAWRLWGGTRLPDLVERRRASSSDWTMACQSVGAMACAERVDGRGVSGDLPVDERCTTRVFSTGRAWRRWGNMRSRVPRGCDTHGLLLVSGPKWGSD